MHIARSLLGKGVPSFYIYYSTGSRTTLCFVWSHGFSNILLSPTTCYGPLTNLERTKLHHTRNPRAHPYLKRFHLGIYIGDNFFFSPSINVCFIIWCIVLFNSKYIKIYLKKHGVNEYI